jgi:hypothetical protein
VEGRQFAKQMAGDLFFAWSALRVLFTQFDRGTAHLRVTLGDEIVEGAFTVLVQNVDPYTYLGARPIRLLDACSTWARRGWPRSLRTTLVAGPAAAIVDAAAARAVYGRPVAGAH